MDEEKLRASLIAHEGNVPYVYDDATGKPIVKGTTVIGNPTVGTGRLLTRAKGLSQAERDLLLDNDIASCVAEASAQSWWPVVENDDVRSRAFCEVIFNIGLGGINGFTKALAAAMRGDWTTCADEFENSAWFTQVGSAPGQRGQVIVQMIRTGQDP